MTKKQVQPNAKLTDEQWAEIEALYRAGTVGGVRQIAKDYGIAHVTIIRKAKKKGWIANEIKAEVVEVVAEKRAEKVEKAKGATSEGATKGATKAPGATKAQLLPKEQAVAIAVEATLVNVEKIDRVIFEAAEHQSALSETLRDLRAKQDDPERAAQAAVLLATDGYLMGVKVLMDSAEKLQRMTLAQINFGEARKDKADGEKVLDLKAVPMSELLLMEKTLGTVLKG